MKKIYRKPNLNIESFVTEEVMTGEPNALSGLPFEGANSTEWEFVNPGEGNVLHSIDYNDFIG